MKAVVLTEPCGPADMKLCEIPIPGAGKGWVLIRVMAFGINHSEVLLRRFEVANDYIRKPIVPGIECVGIVEDPSDSLFHRGERVMALMGRYGQEYPSSHIRLFPSLPDSRRPCPRRTKAKAGQNHYFGSGLKAISRQKLHG